MAFVTQAVALPYQREPPMSDAFCPIPETKLPDGLVIPSFELGQYPCSRGADGKIAVCADGKPIVQVSYFSARESCSRAGYKLLTMRQALVIAYRASTWPDNYECHNDNAWLRLTADSGASFHDNFDQWVFDDLAGTENGKVNGADDAAYETAAGYSDPPAIPCRFLHMGVKNWDGMKAADLFASFARESFIGGRLNFSFHHSQLSDSQRGFRCTR